MNNLCFGMKVLNITQIPGGSVSHKNNAVDLAGADAGVDFWYAQGRWKCTGKWASGSNTYFFSPVDENGNYTKVHCADGVDRIVTLAMTHSNLKYVATKVGAIYENVPMYEEGTYGNASGNHIHLEVAEGVQTTKSRNSLLGWYWFNKKWNAYYTMENELNPLDVFYIRDDFTTVKSTHDTELKHCDGLNYEEEEHNMKLKIKTTKGAQYIRKSLSFTSSAGKPNGTILATIPKGNTEAIVTGFVGGIQKDGYQWVKVNYNGVEGYCQWDSKYFEVYEY